MRLCVGGELDLAVTDRGARALEAALTAATEHIVLDLGRVTS